MLSSKDQNILDTIFSSQDGEIVLKSVDSETIQEQEVSIEVRQLEMDGLSFVANEDWEQAIDSFSKAIQIDPRYGTSLWTE